MSKSVHVLEAGSGIIQLGNQGDDSCGREPAFAVPVVQCESIVLVDDGAEVIIETISAYGPNQLDYWMELLDARDEPFGLAVAEDKHGDVRGWIVFYEGDPLIETLEEQKQERAADEEAITALLLSGIPV